MLFYPKFRFFLLIASIFTTINIGIATICLYFWQEQLLQLILKPLPVFLMIMIMVFYTAIYQRHRYAIILISAFVFFMIGDILLVFPKDMPFMLGILAFSIGRILMIFAFITTAYRYQEISVVFYLKWWYGLALFPYLIACLITSKFIIDMHPRSIIQIIGLTIYTFLCASCMATAYFRLSVKEYIEETKAIVIICLIGSILISTSDTFIGINHYLINMHISESVIMILYWVGMTMISLSVLRDWSIISQDEKLSDYELLDNFSLNDST